MIMSIADVEQFSLRWNNFQSNLSTGFHSFLQEEHFVDVTLAAEGQFLHAHKLVLAVCSPYFKELFKVNPCQHPIVILKDVQLKELEAVLQFMYQGEVHVRQDDLSAFLKTAELLQVKGLTGNGNDSEPEEAKSDVLQRKHSATSPSEKKPDVSDITQPTATTQSLPMKRSHQTPEQELPNLKVPKPEPIELDSDPEDNGEMEDDSFVQFLENDSHRLPALDPGGSLGNTAGLSLPQGITVQQDLGQESPNMFCRCPLCGKMMRKRSLRTHIQDRHLPTQESPCHFCHKIFRSANSLQNHISVYHREQRIRKNRPPNDISSNLN